MLEMHVTSKCVPAKSEVASDTFAETCDSMAGMTWATHHYLVAATNYWTKLVAATNTFPENCDLLSHMTTSESSMRWRGPGVRIRPGRAQPLRNWPILQ